MKLIFFIMLTINIMALSGCGKDANAQSSASVGMLTAPDGSTCYVIYSGTTAVGGNCK